MLATIAAVATATPLRRSLLIGSRGDPASVNIFSSLLARSDVWKPVSVINGEEGDVYESANRRAVLWIQDEALLHLDNPDEILNSRYFSDDSKHHFDELIFLSRHTAVSGTASLTIHPIGVPWLKEPDLRSGGQPGKCSPPNIRIACLFRKLLRETKSRGLQKDFQVTLEATHHGPFTKLPAMFVEVGSTEQHWSIPEAGQLWCDLLLEQITSEESAEQELSGTSLTLVQIGGSHYVPKQNDWARLGVYAHTGHSLPSYAIQPLLQAPGESPTYKQVIDEVIASTLQTVGASSEICVLVDLKNESEVELVKTHLALSVHHVRVFTDFKSLKERYKEFVQQKPV